MKLKEEIAYTKVEKESLQAFLEKEVPYDLNKRLKLFVINIFDFVEYLPKKAAGYNVQNQIVRSASSCGANYRAARRGRSTKEYIAKLGIVEEEADECCYWLELVLATNWGLEKETKPLLDEANQITAIIVTLIKNARKRL
jgi:four helix bundle protein